MAGGFMWPLYNTGKLRHVLMTKQVLTHIYISDSSKRLKLGSCNWFGDLNVLYCPVSSICIQKRNSIGIVYGFRFKRNSRFRVRNEIRIRF